MRNRIMNCTLFYVCSIIMLCSVLTISVLAAVTWTFEPITGVTVTVNDATDSSMTDGVITVTAQGEDGFLWWGTAKTATITITNSSDSAATVSFGWTSTSLNYLEIDGGARSDKASGSYSKLLMSANETIAITITTAADSTINTLKLQNFSITAAKTSSNVTFDYDSALGSVTAGGAAVAAGSVVEVPISGSALVATPASGVSFLGWISGDGTLLSKEATYTLKPAGDMTVKAAFASNASGATAWFQVGETHFFDDLNAAAVFARDTATLKRIIPLNDGTVPAGDYEIPAGVQLLIPFSADDDGSFQGAPSDNYVKEEDACSWYDDYDVANFTYRTLTLAPGAVLTCYGEINVNGQRQCNGQPYTGVNAGYHGRLILGQEEAIFSNPDESDLAAQLIMGRGGKLYCYGYITGTGMVDMRDGSEIHENLQICDFPGGSAARDWPKEEKKGNTVFLLSQIYVQNVEAPLRINHGATAYVEVVLSGTLFTLMSVPRSLAYIGKGSGLFQMPAGDTIDPNTYITRIYDHGTDTVNYHFHGSSTVGSIRINETVAGVKIDLNSADYILPIGTTMKLIVEDGTMTMNQKIAIMPGAQVHIKEGATISGSGECYMISNATWSYAYFFDRGTMSLNEEETMGRKYPRYAPLPYIATRNGLSPRVNQIARGYTKETQRYYTDVKSNPSDAKLIVDGTMEIKDGGGLMATYSKTAYNDATITGMSANLGVTGTGVIKFETTNKEGNLNAGDGTLYSLPTTYAKGKLAGLASAVGTSAADAQKTERSFISGTYYGLGTDHGLGSTTYDNYWYNYTISVPEGSESGFTGTTSAPRLWLDYATITEGEKTTENVVGLVANSGVFDFGYDGTTISMSSTGKIPAMALSETGYTLSKFNGDVTLGTGGENPTTVGFVASNAKPAMLKNLSVVFPAGSDLSNYYSDSMLGTPASSGNVGYTVYTDGGNAVAAIGPSEGNYAYAFAKVSDAVSTATGSNPYVTVLQNRTLTDPIVIAADQNITLDLGGKTLTGKVATVFSSAKGKKLVTNNGTLRLINGKITFNGNYLTGNFKSDGNLSATVFNQGTIEYLDNVTLQQTYGSIYCAALLNGTGHTIQEIRSGSYLGNSISAGTAIVNRGTITTIGATGKTVDITGRRGIEMAGAAHLETVGASGSTVNITGGQRGIDCVDGTTVGTIGMERSTVNFITGDYTQHKSCIYADGVVTTIGGEGSTVTFSMKPKATAGMNSYGINVPGGGKVGTIGKPGSVITINGVSAQTGHVDTDSDDGEDYYYTNHMYGIYNAGTITNIGSAASDEYGASDLRINVSHSGENGHCAGIYSTATITNFGAEGAVIYINSDFTGVFNEEKPCEVTAVYGYGIYNSGKFTNGFHPDARIEVVCTQMPFRTGAVTLTLDNVTLVCTNTTKYYPLYNNTSGNSIKLDGGNFYHVLGRDQISHSPGKVTYKTGYTMSSTTRNVTLVDGTTYPCYYIAKSGAGTVTGDVPPTNPDNQGILGDVIAEYLAMEDNSDTYIVLTQNCDEPTSITLTGDVYLDLNGHSADLTGFELGKYNLYVIDSATNAYLTNDGDKAGYIVGFDGASAVHTSDRGASKGKHYVQVEGENGIEFHRAGVSVTTIQYTPGQDYAVFQGIFRGTDAVVDALKGVGFRFNEETDIWYDLTANDTVSYDMPFSYARKLDGVNSVRALLSFDQAHSEGNVAVSMLRDGIAALIEGAST